MFWFRAFSGVSSIIWTSVVQDDVVEQMNKKVELTHLKKLPTVRVGHISYTNPPTKNEQLALNL